MGGIGRLMDRDRMSAAASRADLLQKSVVDVVAVNAVAETWKCGKREGDAQGNMSAERCPGGGGDDGL